MRRSMGRIYDSVAITLSPGALPDAAAGGRLGDPRGGRVLLASIAYLVYAGLVTYASALPTLVVALSTILLLLEIGALLLAVSYAFEIIDVLSRREPELFRPVTQTSPWVALQVATYNEPVDIVRRTLEALSRVDY